MSKRKIHYDNVFRSNERQGKSVNLKGMHTIVGLDISTQKTGVAVYDAQQKMIVETSAWFYGSIKEDGQKFNKFFNDLNHLFESLTKPVLVVSEALYLGRSTIAFAKLNQLYGILKLVAYQLKVNLIFEYPMTIRNKFGLKGNSSKEAIITFVNNYMNMHLKFSNVKRLSDDDIADAIMLVLYGRALLAG